MPHITQLDSLGLWPIFLVSFLLMLLATEIGYRLGRAQNRNQQHEKEPTVGGIVAAELRLLAFMLAFTFSLAASRFEARRETLLDEANSIGTTYLRAKMLRQPQYDSVRKLLREYVDMRLEAVQKGTIQSGIERSNQIHQRLWDEATTAAVDEPRSVPISLFIQSLNELIDLHAKRLKTGIASEFPTSSGTCSGALPHFHSVR